MSISQDDLLIGSRKGGKIVLMPAAKADALDDSCLLVSMAGKPVPVKFAALTSQDDHGFQLSAGGQRVAVITERPVYFGTMEYYVTGGLGGTAGPRPDNLRWDSVEIDGVDHWFPVEVISYEKQNALWFSQTAEFWYNFSPSSLGGVPVNAAVGGVPVNPAVGNVAFSNGENDYEDKDYAIYPTARQLSCQFNLTLKKDAVVSADINYAADDVFCLWVDDVCVYSAFSGADGVSSRGQGAAIYKNLSVNGAYAKKVLGGSPVNFKIIVADSQENKFRTGIYIVLYTDDMSAKKSWVYGLKPVIENV